MNQADHPADTPPGDDAARWRDAARLRTEHSGWVIVWLARARQFRAYKRLPGARRDTSLTAATADALATKITAAEQAAARPARRAVPGASPAQVVAVIAAVVAAITDAQPGQPAGTAGSPGR